MPFPETNRVVYKKNPLDRVICQLRFPPILKIDADIPADFQEIIRGEFPKYKESTDINIDIQPGISNQFPPEILDQMVRTSGKNYEFSSEDDSFKINLTRTFIALSSTKYERWELFKEKLMVPLKALDEIYSPEFFSRLGLRYINIINPSALGLKANIKWGELLQPYIIGILHNKEVGNNVLTIANQHEIKLSDKKSIVRIITQFSDNAISSDFKFKIDNDFFISQKFMVTEAIEKLDYFNERGSRLIRWSITDLLHETMDPQTI